MTLERQIINLRERIETCKARYRRLALFTDDEVELESVKMRAFGGIEDAVDKAETLITTKLAPLELAAFKAAG